MSRPDDIPQDVWDIAIAIETGYEGGTNGRRPVMIARAIMAVSSIHEAETPVAWHTIDIRGRIAETTDFPSVADAWCEQGYTVRPLFAHPAPISKGVTASWDVQEFKVWKGINPDKPVWHSRGFACPTWDAANELLEYLQHNCPELLLRVSSLSHTAGETPCPG